MSKVLVVDDELCVGCERCAIACSFMFFKVYNPTRGAIHTVKLEPGRDVAIACIQCGLCITQCPYNALYRDEKTMVVKVNEEKCTACGYCVQACPYGAIHIDPVKNKAFKCTACGYCVMFCPQSALKVVTAEEAAKDKWRSTAKAVTIERELPPARKIWYKPPLK